MRNNQTHNEPSDQSVNQTSTKEQVPIDSTSKPKEDLISISSCDTLLQSASVGRITDFPPPNTKPEPNSLGFTYLFPLWHVANITDSLARDMLAAERTFLAWVRTGFAIIGLGIAIVRLVSDYHANLVKGFSALLVFAGASCVVYAWVRHLSLLARLLRNQFVVDTLGPLLIVLFTICCAVFSMLIIFL